MNALDQINALKATRREELAAKSADRQASEEQARIEADQRITTALRAALSDENVACLEEYRAGQANYTHHGRVVEIRFEVPGHREIWIKMVRAEGIERNWVTANGSDDNEWPTRWTAMGTTEHGTFLEHCEFVEDALIAAEIVAVAHECLQ